MALDAVLKRLLTRPGFEEFAPLIALFHAGAAQEEL